MHNNLHLLSFAPFLLSHRYILLFVQFVVQQLVIYQSECLCLFHKKLHVFKFFARLNRFLLQLLCEFTNIIPHAIILSQGKCTTPLQETTSNYIMDCAESARLHARREML